MYLYSKDALENETKGSHHSLLVPCQQVNRGKSAAFMSGPVALRLLTFLVFALFFVPQAFASSLINSGSTRDFFSLGDNDGRSYDGLGFDAVSPLQSGNSSLEFLQLGSFTAGQIPQNLEFYVFSEVAAFADQNEIGVVDSQGNFIAAGGNQTPGGQASLVQDTGEEFTIAVRTPQTVFTTVDSDNEDGAAHILAVQIQENMSVEIPRTCLTCGSMTFDVQMGDIILLVEDMLASGNTNPLVPDVGDFDYNDMVVLVRQTNVPEPGSMALLLVGASGLLMRKRQKTSV